MKIKLSILCIGLSLLSGCSSVWEAKYGHDKPHISYASLEDNKKPADKIYVWNPNNNAAYVFSKTGSVDSACVASADVAKSRTYENDFSISIDKIINSIDNAKIEDKIKIIESITNISNKSESATFLNVAMFHICMMSGAEKISKEDAFKLMNSAIDKSNQFIKQGK